MELFVCNNSSNILLFLLLVKSEYKTLIILCLFICLLVYLFAQFPCFPLALWVSVEKQR